MLSSILCCMLALCLAPAVLLWMCWDTNDTNDTGLCLIARVWPADEQIWIGLHVGVSTFVTEILQAGVHWSVHFSVSKAKQVQLLCTRFRCTFLPPFLTCCTY